MSRGLGACIFDARGTLFDLDSVIDSVLNKRPEAAPLAGLWQRRQFETSWLRSLMDSYVDFWHITGESLDIAMAELGLSEPPLRAQLMQNYLIPSVYPEVVDVLTQLRSQGWKTAILSNDSPVMLRAGINHNALNSHFDACLSADETRVYKPHPAVYRLVCDHLNVETQAVWFLSSETWDLAGGSAIGFHTIWVNRWGHHCTNHFRQPLTGEIQTLAELPAFLDSHIS